MSRMLKVAFAFIWLTVGYWIISTIVPLALALLPYAASGGGISMTSDQGVHQVRFSGHPGDLILVLYVSDSGEKNLKYAASGGLAQSSSTTFQWMNALMQLGVAVLFAAISIPLLRRLLRNAEPGALNGGPATQFGNSGVTEGPPSVS